MKSVVSCVLLLTVLTLHIEAESPVPGRIPYYILEGLAPDTLIGNVAIDSGLTSKYDKNIRQQLRYSFLKQSFQRNGSPSDSNLFAVDEGSGILKTAQEIDRDVLCAREVQCLVLLDVAVGPPDYFEVIKAVVDILDVNDHTPVFPEKVINKKVSEATVTGSSFSIPTAVDPDSQAYSVQLYELVSSSNKFELEETEGLDGATDLRLYIKEALDREEADFYQFMVVAHDGGTPSKSGSVLINIEVEDFNDNDPAFVNATYEVYVLENSAVGTTIANVRALDRDAGSNGEITYGFSRQTMNSYGDMFAIDGPSGAIYLKQSLDFERGSTYLLTVTADDGGENSMAGHATVIVRVEDANDNLPVISVNTLTADGVAKISETADVGMFVAHVYASDMDGGKNGQVECAVDSPKFDLEQHSRGKYELVTATKLDFEREGRYEVKVSCNDLGPQPRTSSVLIEVTVLDGNDHAPFFSSQVYMATIRENNFVDQKVLDVNATDADQGLNGQLRYKLHSDARDLFKIHPVTGLITTNAVFDREMVEELSFHVIATDGGVPSLESTATVLVTILDANDEGPVFSPTSFTFGFFENEPLDSEVGEVSATDADTSEFNTFQYQFANPNSEAAQAFKIDPHTGMIFSRRMLDREVKAAYYMTVIASSDQFPPMTSTASVTIYIADQNDHNPQISWPMLHNNTVQVSSELPVGEDITRIEATDMDIGGNGKLTYSISSQVEGNFFAIEATLGIVRLERQLTDKSRELYRLSITVTDSGFPQLHDSAELNIIINQSIPYLPAHRVVHKNNNNTVIISLTSAALLLVFLVVIALVLFRTQYTEKKPAVYSSQPQTVIRTESQKMLQLAEDRGKDGPDGSMNPLPAPCSKINNDRDINCVLNMEATTSQAPSHSVQVSQCVAHHRPYSKPSQCGSRTPPDGDHHFMLDSDGVFCKHTPALPVWEKTNIYLKTPEADNAHNILKASEA